MPWRSLPVALAAVAMIAAGNLSVGAQEKATALKRIKPMEVKPADSELRKLQKLRFNAALDEINAAMLIHEEGPSQGFQTLDAIYEASDRLTEAALDLYADPNNRIKIYERQLSLAKEREKLLSEQSSKIGANDAIALQRAIGHRANVEIALLKARRALEKTESEKSNIAKTNSAPSNTAQANEKNPDPAKPKTTPTKATKPKTSQPKTPQPKTAAGDP